MCKNGANKQQLKSMISMSDENIALSQAWLEKVHHLADHAGFEASIEVAQATVLLGEARAKLEAAIDLMDAKPADSGVEVSLV